MSLALNRVERTKRAKSVAKRSKKPRIDAADKPIPFVPMTEPAPRPAYSCSLDLRQVIEELGTHAHDLALMGPLDLGDAGRVRAADRATKLMGEASFYMRRVEEELETARGGRSTTDGPQVDLALAVLAGTDSHVVQLFSGLGHLASVIDQEDQCRASVIDLLHIAKNVECDVTELRGCLARHELRGCLARHTEAS